LELFRLVGSIVVDSDEAQENIREVNQEAEGTGKKLGGLGGMASKAGVAIAAFGAAAALAAGAVGVMAVKSSDELKKALNGLESQTGATKKEMANLRTGMLDIYKENLGESFNDIGESMSVVHQQAVALGIDSEEAITGITKKALIMRDTFDMDVTESVNAASVMVNQFGLTGDEAYNLIAQGAQQGLNKNGDMLDILREYSPQFKAMGFGAEEMLSILKSGVDDGVWSLDILADGMKEFNILAKDGSDRSKQAFTDLGLEAGEMTKAFAEGGQEANKAFFKTLNAIKAIEDPIKQNEVAIALFGTKFEDLEKGVLDTLTNTRDEFDKTKDTVDKINKVKFNDLESALSGIGRLLEVNLLIPIGDKITPVLQDLANWFLENFPKIQKQFELVGNAIVKMIQAFSAGDFKGLKEQLKGLFPKELHGIIDNIVKGLSGFRDTAIEVFDNVVAVGKPLIDQFFKSFDEFNIDEIIEAFKGLQDVVMNQLIPALEPFVLLIGVALGAAMIGLGGIINGVILSLDDLIKVFLNVYEIVATVIALIVAVVSGDWEKVIDLTKNLAKNIIELFDNLINFVADLIGGFVEFIIAAWIAIYDKVANDTVKKFVDDIIKFFNDLDENVENIIKSTKEFLINSFESIKNTIKAILDAAKTIILVIFKAIKTKVKTIVTSIKNTVKNIFKSMGETIGRIFNSIKTTISTVIGTIKTVVSEKFNTIVETASIIITTLKNTIVNKFNTIKLSVIKVFNSIKKEASSKLKAIKTAVDPIIKAFNSAKTAAKNLISMISRIKMPKLNFPSIPKAIQGLIPGRKDGGIVQEPYTLVGEEGPEIVRLPFGSQVIPNKESMGMVGGIGTQGKQQFQVVINSPKVWQTSDIERFIAKPLIDVLKRKGVNSY